MNSNHHNSASFPWADINRLGTSLQDGELSLATALGQFGAVVRDGLKIIENYAGEQMKLNLDRKLKLEKMDKLVKDLTEKCQCMQQALLYKEEKYDEKCREVERYKVICELSAKSAVNDELYYARDENNNHPNNTAARDPLLSHVDMDDAFSEVSYSTGKKIKLHTKVVSSQASTNSRVPAQPPSRQYQPDIVSIGKSNQVSRDDASNMAAYYAGGPTRRPRRQNLAGGAEDEAQDAQIRDQLTTIGGINIQTSRPGPAPMDRLYRSDNFDTDDRKRSNKIALVGQRNEVISSSRNAANMMRQKLAEKDLHKQVAQGSWNRMASRRKKDWPF